MRIAIVCNDTRGGVQPYVALGQGLARAGHDVRAVAPTEFAEMFENVGIHMASLSGGERAAELRSTGIAEQGVIAAMRFMRRELPAQINQWTRETLAACEGVEIMTGGIGGMVTGLSVAEKLFIPFIETHLQPVGAPTDAYPGVMLPWWPRWLGSTGMRLSHCISDQAAWMAFKRPMSSARAEVLGLTGRSRPVGRWPALYGFSRHVCPCRRAINDMSADIGRCLHRRRGRRRPHSKRFSLAQAQSSASALAAWRARNLKRLPTWS
jgi:sterol 3beta-glucosyltransferase